MLRPIPRIPPSASQLFNVFLCLYGQVCVHVLHDALLITTNLRERSEKWAPADASILSAAGIEHE
jgi:hypothetical protein